jgi:hypothetical protein
MSVTVWEKKRFKPNVGRNEKLGNEGILVLFILGEFNIASNCQDCIVGE